MKVQNKDDRSVPLLETDCGRWVLGVGVGLGGVGLVEPRRREAQGERHKTRKKDSIDS